MTQQSDVVNGPNPVEEESSDDDGFGPMPKKQAEESSSDDEGFGPMPAGGGDDDSSDDCGPRPAKAVKPKKKRRKILANEAVYLDNLPSANMYEKSFMHRDVITHVVASSQEFILTGSADGHIKFWKKQNEGIEFVKHFRAHLTSICNMVLSPNGMLLGSTGTDKAFKLFDVRSFDLIAMIKLDFEPTPALAFVYRDGAPCPLVAIGVNDADTPEVRIYKAEGTADNKPLRSFKLHSKPVHTLQYNKKLHCLVSADKSGMLEVWDPDTLEMPSTVSFQMKSETHLYEMLKNKTYVLSLTVSPDGSVFAAVCNDGRIRIFRATTCKMVRAYDESLEMFTTSQSDPNMSELHLDRIDFGRRSAVEKDLKNSKDALLQSVAFDESGHFVFIPTMLGIKVINLVTNKLVRVLGKIEQTERFLSVALFQDKPKGRAMKAFTMGGEAEQSLTDPTLIACAFKKKRFYMFSRREPAEATDANTGRDVWNEKPSRAEQESAIAASLGDQNILGQQATLITTMGDIVFKLFPAECPKTVENFSTHARNGYYNDVMFHRVIKGFMCQTGDPEGDGTGGESIWGGNFEDEFHRSLKHDRPFTLSMANAGPNTNGSQFFITTVPTPFLDNKHTVFGRVIQGMDVVQLIERVPTNSDDKPYQDIKIIGIQITQ